MAFVIPAIELTTTGGTPTILDYYEDNTTLYTFTGIWAADPTANIRIIRIGKKITLQISLFSPTATLPGMITTNSPAVIPARFIPPIDSCFPIFVQDNGVHLNGIIQILDTGAITIRPVDSTGSAINFSGSGSSGIVYAVYVSYLVA